MEFEWDEAKRRTNIAKHGIDFLRADLLFGGPVLRARARAVRGEERWLATGVIDEVHVTAIFTLPGDTIRIISMRRARDGERKRHQEVFGS